MSQYYTPTPVNPNFDEWVSPGPGYTELDEVLGGLGEGLAVGIGVDAQKRQRQDKGELSAQLFKALMSEGGLKPELAALAASEFEKTGEMRLVQALQDIKGTAQKIKSGEITLKFLEPSMQAQLAGAEADTAYKGAQKNALDTESGMLGDKLELDRTRIMGGLEIDRTNAATSRMNAETQRLDTQARMFDKNGNRRLDPEELESMVLKHYREVVKENTFDTSTPEGMRKAAGKKKMPPEEMRAEARRRANEEATLIREYFAEIAGSTTSGGAPSGSSGASSQIIAAARQHFTDPSAGPFYGAQTLQEVLDFYGSSGDSSAVQPR